MATTTAPKKPAPKKKPVATKAPKVEGITGTDNDLILDLLKSLQPVIDRPIVFHNYGGTLNTPPKEDDGNFYVHSFTNPPEACAYKDNYCNVFNVQWRNERNSPVNCHFLAAGPKGDIIIYTPEGQSMAVLLRNNLYILVDMKNYVSYNRAVFITLFKEIVERIKQSSADSKRKFIDLCASRGKACLIEYEKDLVVREQEVRDLQARLTGAIRETIALKERIRMIKENRPADDPKLVRDFESLTQMEKIVKVDVYNDSLELYTKPLICVNPDTKKPRAIGAFKIQIDTNRRQIRWFNLTRRVGGYGGGMNAPHVFSDGHACLGNSDETFHSLLKAKEFVAAAMVAVQFVEEVNTSDSAGRHIDSWPLAKPEA